MLYIDKLEWKFFVGIFGNDDFTLGDDTDCTLGIGRGCTACIGFAVCGRNDGRGIMVKQGCFTLQFNKCSIWWAVIFHFSI